MGTLLLCSLSTVRVRCLKCFSRGPTNTQTSTFSSYSVWTKKGEGNSVTQDVDEDSLHPGYIPVLLCGVN